LRKVRNSALESRTARAKLEPGRKHWMNLGSGLHLGYRRGSSPVGTWIARRYIGQQTYKLEKLAAADDIDDADNAVVLSFDQAQARARQMHGEKSRVEAGFPAAKGAAFTVAACLASYADALDKNSRRAGHDVRVRATSIINPVLGKIACDKLTTAQIEKWLADFAAMPARIRSPKGQTRYKPTDPDDAEAQRRRQSTANRVLTILKASLNKAWRDGRIAGSNGAWSRVRPFKGVDSARVRYLTANEAKRFLNAAQLDFRHLAAAALATGARYGELVALRVEDFNPESGTVHVRRSKSGKGRHIVLGAEGVQLFESLTAGRAHDALILLRADGTPWHKSAQFVPMAEALHAARIKPAISFHGLRHTWASLSIMAGMPLMVAARNLGHSDTRMVEKHYGHLAPDFVAASIRQFAPSFGLAKSDKVVPARRRA
jgi:integrase